jgi:hypothetical protein
VLAHFAPLFSKRVWIHAQVLWIGAILAPGKRTVTSALKVMGLSDERHFINFHRVLSRARWSGLAASRILLGLLICLLVAAGVPLVLGLDDTVERRSGKKIEALGCYRDAVRSTKKYVVKCFGLKWVSMMLLVPLPFSSRTWALPFLTVLVYPEGEAQPSGRRHKTSVDLAGQMIRVVRRWVPDRILVLVVDGSYAAVFLALTCLELSPKVIMVSRLRLDARLYHFPTPPVPGRRGPKPKKGKRQRSLKTWAKRSDTPWQTVEITWYGGEKRTLQVLSQTALWYRVGLDPVPIRWVLVHDPQDQLQDEAFFCTDLNASVKQILAWVIQRWNVEVTFEEARAHLGMETQRQWSDLAIERTTPVLLGLFSIITLISYHLLKGETPSIHQTAWYKKPEPTFSDLIALVRKEIWYRRYYETSAQNPEMVQFPKEMIDPLINLLSYAA